MTAPLLLTEKEAAAFIGIGARTLAKWRAKGILTAYRPDPDVSRVYYRTADLEEFVGAMEASE
jgi:hypothetical protein